ncbi:MAG TPA: TonB-dependent receptor, partial [Afipia sp.]
MAIAIAVAGLIAARQDAVAQNAETPGASTPLPTVDVVAPRVRQERRTAPQVVPATASPDATEGVPQAPVASASEQNFTGADVNARPFSRLAEALEVVPGL